MAGPGAWRLTGGAGSQEEIIDWIDLVIKLGRFLSQTQSLCVSLSLDFLWVQGWIVMDTSPRICMGGREAEPHASGLEEEGKNGHCDGSFSA